MPSTFITDAHRDLAKGLDNRSAFNNIKAGFAEYIRNMDTNSTGFIETRKGYQGRAGLIPLRVYNFIDNTDDTADIIVNDDISLSELTSLGPIVLYGKIWRIGTGTISCSAGESVVTGVGTSFLTEVETNSMIEVDGVTRRILSVTSNTSLTLATPIIEAWSGDSFTFFTPLEYYFEEYTRTIPHQLVGGDVRTIETANIYGDSYIMAGSVYVEDGKYHSLIPESIEVTDTIITQNFDLTGEGDFSCVDFISDREISDISSYVYEETLTAVDNTLDFTISSEEHGLPNLNIIGMVLIEKPGNIYDMIVPESFIIEEVGDINIILNDVEAGDHTVRVVLYDMPASYHDETIIDGADPEDVYTFKFENVNSKYNFYSVYSNNGNERRLLIPDAVYSDGMDLTFEVTIDTAEVLQVNYMPGITVAKTIRVDLDSIGLSSDNFVDGETNGVEAVVYGIRSSEIKYSNSTAGGDIVNISSYFDAGETTILVGLGGNLFREQKVTGSPLTLRSAILSINERIFGTSVIGPFFGASSVMRSGYRGVDGKMPDGSSMTDSAAVVAVTNNKDETITINLEITDKNGDLEDLDTNDYIILSECGNDYYDGKFQIISANNDDNTIKISVPELPEYVENTINLDGRASIYTNRIKMNSSSLPFVVGDIITSEAFSQYEVDIKKVEDEYIYIDDIPEEILISGGAIITASRITNIIHLTNVNHIVIGDTVSILGYNRQFQVLDVDSVENYIIIDEEILVSDSVTDPTVINVTGRWVPVEAPTLNDAVIQHFNTYSYGNQERLRWTTAGGSNFYNDYTNAVMKYDDNSIFRAGLPNWNPHMRSWVDYSDESIISTVSQYTHCFYDHSTTTAIFYFTSAEYLSKLQASSEVYLSTNGDITAGTYSIKSIDINALTLTIAENVTSGTSDVTISTKGDISAELKASYYFRLDMIDRNNNTVASAVSNPSDCRVTLKKAGSIYHQFEGLPNCGIYDYARIKISIYRTKFAARPLPEYFKIDSFAIDFETANARKSIIVKDTTSDESLPSRGDDLIAASFSSAGELPISTHAPVRSKYMKSLDTKLIQGNIRSNNILEMSLFASGDIDVDTSVFTFGDGTNEVTFEFLDADDHKWEITDVDFSNSEIVTLTMDGTFGEDLTGKWIQIESIRASDDTPTNYNLGIVCGWHKIKAHAEDTNDELVLDLRHGQSGSVTPSSELYGFTQDSNNIPIVSINPAEFPYQYFRDGEVPLTLTTFRYRALRSLRKALNSYLLAEDDAWIIPTIREGSVGTLLLESTHTDRTLTASWTTPDKLEVYINGSYAASSGAGISYVFPSRVLVSLPNIAEIIDNPFDKTGLNSRSVVDINTDDGQEITGLATFFSISANSDSSREGTLLVFKNRSVYAVDINTLEYQKLESMGQGCTIPDSVSAAHDGILFANKSGIYKVTEDLRVLFVGEYLHNYWRDDINYTAATTKGVGFTDIFSRKYKLSIPPSGESDNNEVVVYDYITNNELGAWTVYDNFPVTGWLQTNDESFFSSKDGRVFILRNLNEDSDYRDDTTAITSVFRYAPTAFGDSGTRSRVERIITHLLADTKITGLTLGISRDMAEDFNTVPDTISFDPSEDNAKKLYTFASSISDRTGIYIQVQYTHGAKDEHLIIAGLDYKASLLDELGTTQANS